MANVTTARPGLAGRERVRAQDTTGAEYRTFSARVPALLCLVAGSFGVLGALGAGVRASAVSEANEDPKQVGVVMGYRSGAGWLLAILAVVLMASGAIWLGRRARLRFAAAGMTAAFVVLAILRIAAYDRRAAELAEVARRELNFVGFHAGLGWGAWLLLVAAILACFALIVAALRQLDRWRGLPE